MAGNWKASLKMTLESAGVTKGLKSVETGTERVTKGTEKARDAMGRFIKTGDQLEGTAKRLKSVEAAMHGVGSASSRMGTSRWTELGGKIAVASAAIKVLHVTGDAAKSTFKNFANFEALVRSLGAVTQDTESLTEQMKALADVASKPGIDLNTAVQGSAALQSVGMSAKESREALEQWSNVVATAGGNAETLQGVLLAIRQIESKPHVEQEDVNQILERVPQFAPIAAKLENERDDPKKYIKDATAELAKLPRVAKGAQESVDNLLDTFRSFQNTHFGAAVAGVTSSLADYASNVLEHGFNTDDFEKAASGVYESLSGQKKSPMDLYNASPEEKTQRVQARKDGEEAIKKSRLDAAMKVFEADNAELKLQLEIAKAKAASDTAAEHSAEERLLVQQHAAELAKQMNVSEAFVTEQLKTQARLRTQIATTIEQAQAKRAMDQATGQSDIDKLRAHGHPQAAERAQEMLTETNRVRELREANVPEDQAREQARTERNIRMDQRAFDRTGRTKSRGAVSQNTVSGLDAFDFNQPGGDEKWERQRRMTPTLDRYMYGVDASEGGKPGDVAGRTQLGGIKATRFGKNSIEGTKPDKLAGAAMEAKKAAADPVRGAMSAPQGLGQQFLKYLRSIEQNTKKSATADGTKRGGDRE